MTNVNASPLQNPNPVFYNPSKLPLSAWAEDDKPINKLLLKGKFALSDSELISILIGSGSTDENAVELSKRLMASCGHNLNALGKLSAHDLMKFKGIGENKAATIIAAIELGRRRKAEDTLELVKINSSIDAANIFVPILGDLLHEEFWMLFLNRNNGVMGKKMVSSGGTCGTVVDTKMIFQYALEHKAISVILCHNHPSGNVKPSHQDVDLTKKLVAAGRIMDIPVLDHVIIGGRSHLSFADEGMM